MSGVKLEDGKMFNVSVNYRGNNQDSIFKMSQYIMSIQDKMKEKFVEWIPDNVQCVYL